MRLDEEGFAALMAPLGPFETAPRLAVGVSGGADSLALVLLADGWARERGGSVTALTVDHGLRREAAEEAAQVGRWMAARGITHQTLESDSPVPPANLQAEARALRHRLLRQWCRQAGVLHLLLAHTLGDQAETLLLRLARGSGVSGLAGMAAVSWTPEVRILRPLLGVPRAALESFLDGQGLDWVRDPSNLDRAFGRVRMRHLLPLLEAEGAGPQRLAGTARRLGSARQVVEGSVADLMAAAVAPHPAGYVHLDPAPLRDAPAEIGVRALRTVLACVGGKTFGPRAERAEAALMRLGKQPATLGGCRMMPARDGRLLVVREVRALPEVFLESGQEVLWDGRFRVRLAQGAGAGTVAALGDGGWTQVRGCGVLADVPAAVRRSVPALWRNGKVVAVPRFSPIAGEGELTARWAPVTVLVSGGFRLAAPPSSII